ncbi:type II secretion system protein GspG [Corallococcus macrosporus]|uniref:GspG family general secretion pathway protein n=2 Tax=Myxococcaceae TaxID=31 RepID=F8CID0_MYXFH|nr:type II secretion system protein GspG [Corallococcus macrosporus]AEI63789.1 GspG family general secretion pathway protein [Corallococcus macrosporus]AEI63799.1 GspG family general secretion pathway protein [Corallococcus macrosporus]ATB51451.1 general secretion pathway protein GspG [Corallococcus macrosporus DSM 14697]
MNASDEPPPSRRSPVLFVGLVFGLGLVVAILVGALSGSKAIHADRIHQDFVVLEEALGRYRADKGALPEEADLEALLVPAYLPSVPLDPWGRAYRYTSNGEQVFLATFGKSDDRGGAGEEQDHTNHDGHAAPKVAR